MPPKHRNPEQGGGGYLGEQSRADALTMSREHGITEQEAVEIIMAPVFWMARLATSDEPREDIIAEIRARIEELEAHHGPHTDWDVSRIAMGQALLALGEFPDAITFFAGVSDISAMADSFINFMVSGIREGAFTITELAELNDMLQQAFIDAGRGAEFMRIAMAKFLENAPEGFDRTEVTEAVEKVVEEYESNDDWIAQGRRRYPTAWWEEIIPIVDDGSLWPEETAVEARRKIASLFASMQHQVLSEPKKSRKKIEMLKTAIKTEEGKHPAAVWDRFRFVAALSLFKANEPNFGRGMARSMTDETMIGEVCLTLAMDGWEREAWEVAEEIPSSSLFAQVVHSAEWEDRTRAETLLTDMTVVTTQNRRKYDPERRLGVAEGLLELFTASHAEAEEAGDTEAATHWRARAEVMDSRAKLLRKQIEMHYITAPAKKK